MDKQHAYNALWSRFGIPAYDENSVPDETTIKELIESGVIAAEFPYITYQVVLDELDSPVAANASLWDRNTSWLRLDTKLAEINDTLSNIGPLPLDEGFMYVTKGSPWAQRMTDETDKMVKRYALIVNVEFLTPK